MSPALAVLLAAGAVAGVLYVTKRQEAATAMRAQNITNHKNSAVLSGGDVGVGIAAGVATYYAGPAAGRAVVSASGRRL